MRSECESRCQGDVWVGTDRSERENSFTSYVYTVYAGSAPMDYSLPLSYKSQILNCSQPRLSSSIGRYPCRLINRDKHRTPVVVCYGSSPVRPSDSSCAYHQCGLEGSTSAATG